MPVVLLVVAVASLAFIMLRSGGPSARAVFLRRTGLTFMCAATAMIALFVVGDAVGAPGGWRVAALAAAWLAPLAGLSLLAWSRPGWAAPVLSVLTAGAVALAIWSAAAPGWWQALETQNGPVRALVSFALGLPAALLGWRRPALGAPLLLTLGLVPVLVSAAGPGYGEASLIAVSTPPALTGVLYIAAEILARRAPGTRGQAASPETRPPDGPPPPGGIRGAGPAERSPADGRLRRSARLSGRLRELLRRADRVRSPATR